MIELKHVSKRFNNELVLKDINLTFPRYGIVMIYGSSGCGKTTLLNVISSLYDFEGEITFNGKKYSTMTPQDRDQLRNSKIGFVFQDYKLFEFETVKNNLLFALDIKSNDKRNKKERRVNDLLKIIGLYNRADTLVSKLSGGEKQRIAIARAICNSPSLILADEPTGNLDTKNSEMIMELMERISKTSLVIMVSHDQELTKKYADQIVYMKDGRIEKTEYNNHNHHVDLLPLVHINAAENKPCLPLGFCIKHTINNIKHRKWRTIFVFLTSSLGLLTVGLGTVLTSIISTNLYNSYSSIIDSNKVIITPKDKTEKSRKIQGLKYDEVMPIVEERGEDANSVGVYYWNNFETMFTNYSISFDNGIKERVLPNFILSYINEYTSLNGFNKIIYPVQINQLENDEVILGLSYPTLNEICFQLSIKRNADSLSSYLKDNVLNLDIYASNTNWSYDVNFPIRIKGFVMTGYNCLIHSNPNWNEYIFEEKFGLSSSEIINKPSKNPWDLKKSYYVEFKNRRDDFLTEMKFSKKYKDVVCEVLTSDYYPNLYKDYAYETCPRVALLKRNSSGISGFYNFFIKSSSKDIKSLVYGSKNGYAIYPESLMMGFSKTTYLSNELSHIEEAIDLTAYLKYEESMNITVPNSVIEGHFAKSNLQGLVFNPTYNLIEGRKPLNYGEIVVSKGVIDRLNMASPIDKWIYISFPITEELLPNGYLSRDYRTASLKVVGISDSSKNEISNMEEWSVMFFQTHLGVSNLDLEIDSMAAEINEDKEDQVISQLARAFPRFDSVSPISNVKESIKNVCGYIEKILLILSISSVIISSLLLSICNYLHFVEIKKDIGLVRCIGVTKNESSKFVFVHSLFLGTISMIIASAQLMIVCYFLSRTLSDMFEITSTFIFDPLALVYMFLVTIVISLISSLVIKKKVNKLDPIACLRA